MADRADCGGLLVGGSHYSLRCQEVLLQITSDQIALHNTPINVSNICVINEIEL